jgi:hypothetical protein
VTILNVPNTSGRILIFQQGGLECFVEISYGVAWGINGADYKPQRNIGFIYHGNTI